MTAVSMTLTALLALDDDAVVLRHLLRSRRTAQDEATGRPACRAWCSCRSTGSRMPVLQRAVRDGNAPTLAGWLRAARHRLTAWTTGWSSQTGA